MRVCVYGEVLSVQVWDTLMAKWAGEATDWVQDMTTYPPKEEDVIVAVLKMTKQPTCHAKDQGNWIL